MRRKPIFKIRKFTALARVSTARNICARQTENFGEGLGILILIKITRVLSYERERAVTIKDNRVTVIEKCR